MLSQSQKQALNKQIHSRYQNGEFRVVLGLPNPQTQVSVNDNKILLQLMMMFSFSKSYKKLGIQVPTGKEREYFGEIINYWAEHELVDLEMLTLRELYLTDEMFLSIKINKWQNLKCLTLLNNCLTKVSMIYLIQQDLPILAQFCICFNLIDAKACGFIAKGNWPRLQVFCCRSNNTGNEGIQELIKGKWPLLSYFIKSENRLNKTRSFKVNLNGLSKCIWNNIQKINLDNNAISRKGVKEIVRANFHKLYSLQLNNCQITDEGMIDLTKGNWPFLGSLSLYKNKIGNKGINFFAKSANLKNIKYITFSLYRHMRLPIIDLSMNPWNKKDCEIQLNFQMPYQIWKIKIKVESELALVKECNIKWKIDYKF